MAYRRSSVRRRSSSPRRQFVWHRFINTLQLPGPDGQIGHDLLAGYRAMEGSDSMGITIMRVRGLIQPTGIEGTGLESGGTFGLLVDSVNSDPTYPLNAPEQRPHEDWLGWMPWHYFASPSQASGTWNPNSSIWAVDVKANRKAGELAETLWLWTSTFPTGITAHINLSIGMKLS